MGKPALWYPAVSQLIWVPQQLFFLVLKKSGRERCISYVKARKYSQNKLTGSC